MKNQLEALLQRRGFELRKYASNSHEFLKPIPRDHCQYQPLSFDSEADIIVKILGIMWPVTFVAKYLNHYIWSLDLNWDQEPPPDVVNRWNQYKSEFPQIFNLKISRCITPEQYKVYQLHGFCDSSEKGYAAVVYLRFKLADETCFTFLICSKTKVAPIKRIATPS